MKIYTKITKKYQFWYFGQRTLLFAKLKFFRTWRSCLFEVLKNVTNLFLVPKNCQLNFSFQPLVQDLWSFNVFFEKISTTVISNSFFLLFPFHRKSIFYSFQDIDMRFAAFYSQLSCLQNVENRFFNFCLKNFLRLFKIKKIKKKIFVWFWKVKKKFWDKNSKICYQEFVDRLVVSRMPRTACRYLENFRRRSISRNPLLFQWATLQTGNSVDFQNILNRPSNGCLWCRHELFWDYLN